MDGLGLGLLPTERYSQTLTAIDLMEERWFIECNNKEAHSFITVAVITMALHAYQNDLIAASINRTKCEKSKQISKHSRS